MVVPELEMMNSVVQLTPLWSKYPILLLFLGFAFIRIWFIHGCKKPRKELSAEDRVIVTLHAASHRQ